MTTLTAPTSNPEAVKLAAEAIRRELERLEQVVAGAPTVVQAEVVVTLTKMLAKLSKLGRPH
jgi:hypothetical protein